VCASTTGTEGSAPWLYLDFGQASSAQDTVHYVDINAAAGTLTSECMLMGAPPLLLVVVSLGQS